MTDRYRHWLPRLIARTAGRRTWAVTISAETTLYSSPVHEVIEDEQWWRHENCHKKQFQEFGWFGFVCRYLWETCRRGYRLNKYEVAARMAETGEIA